MHFIFSRYRTPIALILAVLLSGIPVPLVDSHPTSCTEVGDNIYLREHLSQMPRAEHEDVGDAELHIHWICPMVDKKCNGEHIAIDSARSLLRLQLEQLVVHCAFTESYAAFRLESQCSRCRGNYYEMGRDLETHLGLQSQRMLI